MKLDWTVYDVWCMMYDVRCRCVMCDMYESIGWGKGVLDVDVYHCIVSGKGKEFFDGGVKNLNIK